MLNWILKLTKAGAAIEKTRLLLDGKKVYLVGAATAIPALINLVLDFQRDGLPALTNLAGNQNYELLMLGLGMLTGRATLTKVARGNDKIEPKP